MTTAKPDDRSTLVDPRVADTWRAASSEEPPASLDAAILAAARREVSARPEALATWKAREARASRRRWWPLAAAATVAAIAVGMLQVTPTDRLGAPATESAIVSDVPTPVSKPATAAKPVAEEKPDVAAEPSPLAAVAPPAAKEERKTASRDDGGTRSDASRKDFPRQAAPSVVAPAAAPAAPPAAQSRAQPAAPPSAHPAPPPAPAEPRPQIAGAPDPFPAAPKVTAEPAPSASREVAASRAERAPPTAAAAPSAAPTATPPPAPAPLAKMATGRTADDARARDRTALPVADWIALIRRLRTEGKQAEAAKELAAFRAAHPDHEKLLPPDLRDWREK